MGWPSRGSRKGLPCQTARPLSKHSATWSRKLSVNCSSVSLATAHLRQCFSQLPSSQMLRAVPFVSIREKLNHGGIAALVVVFVEMRAERKVGGGLHLGENLIYSGEIPFDGAGHNLWKFGVGENW